jgi:hypothetical protein
MPLAGDAMLPRRELPWIAVYDESRDVDTRRWSSFFPYYPLQDNIRVPAYS